MNPQFQQMLQEATRLTRAGRLDEATRMIQHALRGQPGKGESAEARDVPAQMPGGPPAAMNEAAAIRHGGRALDFTLHLPPAHRGRALPLVVMCATGARSSRAAAQLRKAGYGNVHNLAGGNAAWREASLPIEKSA